MMIIYESLPTSQSSPSVVSDADAALHKKAKLGTHAGASSSTGEDTKARHLNEE